MPIIKSAKKALRQTIARTKRNRAIKENLKRAIKKATPGKVAQVQSLVDKAVKRRVVSAARGGRLKARLFAKIGAPKSSPTRNKQQSAINKKTAKRSKPKKVSS